MSKPYEMVRIAFLGVQHPGIQRPGNCPDCGYWDPFHASWYTPEKEVADPQWVKEWDHVLWSLINDNPQGITVAHDDGDWWYHLTRTGRTIERWPLSVLKAGISPAERVSKTWRQKHD